MFLIIKKSCGEISLNLSSFTFAAKQCNNVQVGGPHVFGDIL
jgi:hypothetical protein